MQKRVLGKNGPDFSVLGMGTWAAGGNWQFGYGLSNDREIIDAVHYGIDAGINWIDTAPAYGLGHAEELVAKAVKGKRQQVYIATKCGLLWNKRGKIRKELSPQTIRQEVEDSLKRLQIDVIDLYQIHWPDPARSMQTAWHAMAKLQKEGKVRWIGVSNVDEVLLANLHGLHSVQSCQPKYNLINRQAEEKVLPVCKDNRIGVVSYSPLHSGLLSESFDPIKISATDWRKRDVAFNQPLLGAYMQLVDQLSIIARKYEKSVTQLALNWIVQHPVITSAIVGIRTAGQLQQLVNALDFSLHTDDLYLIKELTQNCPQPIGHH